jgi:hypothetical protein
MRITTTKPQVQIELTRDEAERLLVFTQCTDSKKVALVLGVEEGDPDVEETINLLDEIWDGLDDCFSDEEDE